jgi:hypothetical protein
VVVAAPNWIYCPTLAVVALVIVVVLPPVAVIVDPVRSPVIGVAPSEAATTGPKPRLMFVALCVIGTSARTGIDRNNNVSPTRVIEIFFITL